MVKSHSENMLVRYTWYTDWSKTKQGVGTGIYCVGRILKCRYTFNIHPDSKRKCAQACNVHGTLTWRHSGRIIILTGSQAVFRERTKKFNLETGLGMPWITETILDRNWPTLYWLPGCARHESLNGRTNKKIWEIRKHKPKSFINGRIEKRTD